MRGDAGEAAAHRGTSDRRGLGSPQRIGRPAARSIRVPSGPAGVTADEDLREDRSANRGAPDERRRNQRLRLAP